MRIEINYSGRRVNSIMEEKIVSAMNKINAKQFSRGVRKDGIYIWFDLQEDSKSPKRA